MTIPKIKIPDFIRDFLQENLNRLFIKKPKFFTYWQWISGTLSALCGIPLILMQFPDLNLPDWMEFLSNKLVTGAAIGMWYICQITVNRPPIAQTEEGEPMKVVDEGKMPLTAKAEKKETEKLVPQPPVVEGLPEPDQQ